MTQIERRACIAESQEVDTHIVQRRLLRIVVLFVAIAATCVRSPCFVAHSCCTTGIFVRGCWVRRLKFDADALQKTKDPAIGSTSLFLIGLSALIGLLAFVR